MYKRNQPKDYERTERGDIYQVPGRLADGLNMFADPWRNRQISDGGEKVRERILDK